MPEIKRDIIGLSPPAAPQEICVLGGGQLGAMLCEAARRMGYTTLCISPEAADPAAQWADRHISADPGDPLLVRDAARHSAAIAVEAESINPASLVPGGFCGTLSPGADVQRIVRDRRLEKTFLAENGLAVGPFRLAENADELTAAATELLQISGRVVAKTARGGYDGRGQVWLESIHDAPQAWRTLGQVPVVVEAAVDFAAEISVIVARNNRGEKSVFPVFQNEHRNGILFQTQMPAPQPLEVVSQAQSLAMETAEMLAVVGLLTVEMFVLKDGRVWINELAARPHNSGHVTLRAASRSQFEMHICAIMGLPLPPVDVLAPAVMTNLLGDLWSRGEPNWGAVLADGRATIHLYGKAPRPGRKMGHMIHTGETLEAAQAAGLKAFNNLAAA